MFSRTIAIIIRKYFKNSANTLTKKVIRHINNNLSDISSSSSSSSDDDESDESDEE